MQQPTPAFHLEPTWEAQLFNFICSPEMHSLSKFVSNERAHSIVYPKEQEVFQAFWCTPFDQVKVVIMGQDPYHGPGQAHGLSFSVHPGIPLPPSLRNIYTELCSDLNTAAPKHGCLLSWALQGVLLLNATLTVKEASPLSHHKKGWERFTDEAIRALCRRSKPILFVLWGSSAQEKWRSIKECSSNHHTVLMAPHPSPLSAHRGFFGSRPFSKINQWLEQQGETPIRWV